MKNRVYGLFSLMKGSRLRYSEAIIAVALSTCFAIAAPLVIRTTIDTIIGDKPLEEPGMLRDLVQVLGGRSFLAGHLWIPAVFLVVLTMGEGLFTFLKGKWSALASERIAMNLRERLYDHLQRLSFTDLSSIETGDLLQRCTSDVETIRKFFSVQIVEVGRALIMLGGIIPVMFYLDVKMTLISMAVVPFIFSFAVIFFVKVKQAFRLSDEAEAELSTVLQENLTGIRVVRAFARQDYEIRKFEEKNVQYRNRTFRLIRLLACYWAVSDFLSLLQIAIVLILGSVWTTKGKISLGTFVVFLSYENSLLWPVRQMGRILTDMGKALVSTDRIREILAVPEEDMTEGRCWNKGGDVKGDISFAHVNFCYGDGPRVLKDITFRVDAGETIAIIGATGSGKSTLIHLLSRLYDYDEGSITIDGVELKTLDRMWIRSRIGIVLQEPFLFSKTIGENIRFGADSTDEEEMYAAARIASIHDVILGFERGYDTPVGEKGITLSGGQKQRIAIARAILSEAPILIFDDSLSAVDNETDEKIQHSLKERHGRATTFIISHRLTTVSQADRILVLEDGRIIQSGSHEELLDGDGPYRRLWNIQTAMKSSLSNDSEERTRDSCARSMSGRRDNFKLETSTQ
jgi:ATP-binding cassette subfamily B protein